MKTYSKPALTIEQQIYLLEQRGLIIADEDRAARHLRNVSYYRISAYMLPYRILDADGNHLDQFVPGSTWDDIYTYTSLTVSSDCLFLTPLKESRLRYALR